MKGQRSKIELRVKAKQTEGGGGDSAFSFRKRRVPAGCEWKPLGEKGNGVCERGNRKPEADDNLAEREFLHFVLLSFDDPHFFIFRLQHFLHPTFSAHICHVLALQCLAKNLLVVTAPSRNVPLHSGQHHSPDQV